MWPFKKKTEESTKSVSAPAPAVAKTPTDVRAAVREVKSRIKALAVLQRRGKRARKTTIPAAERAALLTEFGFTEKSTAWQIAAAVTGRRGEITAHLNFYHELRGSEHRHDVKDGTEYEYARTLDALCREFPLEK